MYVLLQEAPHSRRPAANVKQLELFPLGDTVHNPRSFLKPVMSRDMLLVFLNPEILFVILRSAAGTLTGWSELSAGRVIHYACLLVQVQIIVLL
jgi:hypothetical protein